MPFSGPDDLLGGKKYKNIFAAVIKQQSTSEEISSTSK
jgi:hypothetical protein